jgi:hypothetical protein
MNAPAARTTTGILAALILSVVTIPGFGHELTDTLSVGGTIAGSSQFQQVSDAPGTDDELRAGLAIQPELSFRPAESDELFFKLGFGVGNGLNKVSPFNLAPWAAYLEDDVKHINGRNRDYLLTAWYRHRFVLDEAVSLGLTGGLIDATDYIDENAFANDEYTQFMNQALVNSPSGFAPSYDGGAAAELAFGDYTLKGVFMRVGENDDGNGYGFYAAQLGYRLKTPLGEGNYRVVGQAASDDFLDPQGDRKKNRAALLISFDQQLGDSFGAWIRFGWQDDQAAVNYTDIYSGGINISGKGWGRGQDNIGIGYAYLGKGNMEIKGSKVAEIYARFALDRYLALTLDMQYMKDEYSNADDPNGFIYGLRLAAGF